MKTLKNRFAKYTGSLRSWKASYVLYNFLNRDKLAHNKVLYPKYGIHKNIISPIGKKDLPERPTERPWLDQPNALQRLKEHPDYKRFSADTRAQIHQFVEEGYLILKGFFEEDKVDALNAEVDALLNQQEIDFNYSGRKIMNAHRHSEVANQDFFRHPELLELMQFIMSKPVIPFQTITFVKGSEQRAHSDSIHMTTYPQGYLIAAWVALEDIQAGSGELFYYPGSHRYPFLSTEDYPSGNTRWRLGAETNKRYEDRIAELIREKKAKKKTFLAKKGDVLLWHANLLHGGSPIDDSNKTRRSLVAHYYGEEVICYHEMTQRPTLFLQA
ncbi:MAG TPA: phytanoyl-CoA dioxygenase family protein [Saprospiraceae bacterium]|nr:phytanoyl-CoA dioxygenase family protein [Saprospiraceae bacterium]